MKTGRHAKVFLFLVLSFGAPLASAGDHPLGTLPPLFELTVFQSETDPEHYLVLGKTKPSQNSGNWYVLDWKKGMVRSPKLKPESFVYFGGGFDFHYESGEWLYIPGGNSQALAPGATLETVPPGLIDPRHGREPLRSLPVDEKLLDTLSLTKFVSPDEIKQLGTRATAATYVKPVASTEEIRLFAIPFDPTISETKDLVRALKRALEEDKTRAIAVEEIMSYDTRPSVLYVWGFESQAVAIQKWAQDELKVKAEPYTELMPGKAADVKPVSDMDAFYATEVLARIPVAVMSFVELELQAAGKLSSQEAEEAAVRTLQILRALENGLERIQSVASNLREFWQNGAQAADKIETRFIAPYRSLLLRGYEILHSLQTPLARELLLFGGGSRYAGSSQESFLNRLSGAGSETYFQTWLRILREKISWVDTATDAERKEMRVSNRGGGVLRQFGFLNVEMRDFRKGNTKLYYSPEDLPTTFPLRVFGLVDSPTYRSDLVRFVIEMDKVAERHRLTYHDEHPHSISGSQTLYAVVASLSWASLPNSPGFSRVLYFTQAIQIICELLDTSRITIQNSMNYLTILDTAVALQKAVKSIYGVVPNAKANTPELNALTEQLMLLHEAVQVRMIRGMAFDRSRKPEDCPGLLKAM